MGHHSNKVLMERIASLPKPTNKWPAWIVTGGGLGFLRPAPGSWGTLGPAIIYWMALYYQWPEPWRSVVLLLGALITGALLVYFGKWACAYFQKPDPGSVVLDEFSGFWVTVAFLPVPAHFASGLWNTWLFTAAVYVLFRLTDTLKIPPASQLEKLPWGWGILLDDIAAGIQANLIAQLLVHTLPL